MSAWKATSKTLPHGVHDTLIDFAAAPLGKKEYYIFGGKTDAGTPNTRVVFLKSGLFLRYLPFFFFLLF